MTDHSFYTLYNKIPTRCLVDKLFCLLSSICLFCAPPLCPPKISLFFVCPLPVSRSLSCTGARRRDHAIESPSEAELAWSWPGAGVLLGRKVAADLEPGRGGWRAWQNQQLPGKAEAGGKPSPPLLGAHRRLSLSPLTAPQGPSSRCSCSSTCGKETSSSAQVLS